MPSSAALPSLVHRLACIPWLPLVGIAVITMLPGLLIGPSLDAAVFSTVGWRITDGELLYATVWDHKPPGVYAPQLLAQVLTDSAATAWIAVWATTVAAAAFTAWLVQYRLFGLGISWPARIAGCLGALTLGTYLLTLGGGLGESFAVVPATAAVVLLTARRPLPQPWLIAGLLLGAATLISLQAFSVVAAIAVVGWDRRGWVVVRRGAAVSGGFLIATALFTASLVISGTLDEALDALVAYNAAYRSAVRPGGSNLLPWVIIVLLPVILPAAMALLSARRRPLATRLVVASMAWAGATIVAVLVQGRLYGHYALPLAVPLSLLAGIGLEGMRRRLPGGTAGRLLLAGPVLTAIVLALVVGAYGAVMEQTPVIRSNGQAGSVAVTVASITPDDETLFVWGNEPRLYELADRPPASRYVYLYPLLTPGYADAGVIAGVLSELEADPPTVFVDAGSVEPGAPGMPPLLIDRPVSTDGREVDLLDPLRDFVRERYELATTVAGWPIYVRRTP